MENNMENKSLETIETIETIEKNEKIVYVSLVEIWGSFDYEDNFIINNLFDKQKQNIEYTSNYSLTDIFIIGSMLPNNGLIHHIDEVCKKTSVKILIISEPIEYFADKLVYNLYTNNYFQYVMCCIESNKERNRYKYPLYMLRFCNKEQHIDTINQSYFQKMNDYVKTVNIYERNFCALINRHDNGYTRTPMYNALMRVCPYIHCPSKLFNNESPEILDKYGHDVYLKNFLFSICPENCECSINGYITEKLMNCCSSGAIPIYFGGFDEVDARIFNKNRIFIVNPRDEKSLEELYQKVLFLIKNPTELDTFFKQDIFCSTAYETCLSMHNDLKNLFQQLIDSARLHE